MKDIKTVAELNTILNSESNDLVVVKFSASWCNPCKMLTDTITGIEPNINGVKFYEVDVDEAEETLIDEYQIQSVPVMIFFNEGLQVDRVVGARGKADLLALIEKNK